MTQPFRKSSGLNIQDLLAAPVSAFSVGRDKRMRIKTALQPRLHPLHMYRQVQIVLRLQGKICRHPAPFKVQTGNVKVGKSDFAGIIRIIENPALRKHRAVFQHHDAAAENNVLRGLPVSRAAVNVICHRARADRRKLVGEIRDEYDTDEEKSIRR